MRAHWKCSSIVLRRMRLTDFSRASASILPKVNAKKPNAGGNEHKVFFLFALSLSVVFVCSACRASCTFRQDTVTRSTNVYELNYHHSCVNMSVIPFINIIIISGKRIFCCGRQSTKILRMLHSNCTAHCRRYKQRITTHTILITVLKCDNGII